MPITRKQTRRLITFSGIAVIVGLVAFMVFLQLEASRSNDFKSAFEKIVVDTDALTQEYTAEEDKWLPKDNNTLIQVIGQYLPRYDQLIDRAKALNGPEKYNSAKEYLISTIQLERDSYERFRNYLVTANQSEYQQSSDLISMSLQQSINADAAIKGAG